MTSKETARRCSERSEGSLHCSTAKSSWISHEASGAATSAPSKNIASTKCVGSGS